MSIKAMEINLRVAGEGEASITMMSKAARRMLTMMDDLPVITVSDAMIEQGLPAAPPLYQALANEAHHWVLTNNAYKLSVDQLKNAFFAAGYEAGKLKNPKSTRKKEVIDT